MRKCNRCLVEKPIENFNFRIKSKGLRHYTCRPCMKEYLKKYNDENAEKLARKKKDYYRNNIDKCKEAGRKYYEKKGEIIREKRRDYVQKNKEKVADAHRKWYYEDHQRTLKYQRDLHQKHRDKRIAAKKEFYKNNRAKIREQNKKWREKNKEAIAEREREDRKKNPEKYRARAKKRMENPSFVISQRVSAGIRHAIGSKKAGHKWEALVGYTLNDLTTHLEKQFLDGMTWDNIGEWHIDHIIPQTEFDQTDPDQLKSCWCLSNLRPLWARDNLSKNNRRVFLL